MSRWLKSVNNLLDKLDDGIVATDAAALAQRVVAHAAGRRHNRSSSDEDEEEEEDYGDEDDDYEEQEEEEQEDYDDEDDDGGEEEEEYDNEEADEEEEEGQLYENYGASQDEEEVVEFTSSDEGPASQPVESPEDNEPSSEEDMVVVAHRSTEERNFLVVEQQQQQQQAPPIAKSNEDLPPSTMSSSRTQVEHLDMAQPVDKADSGCDDDDDTKPQLEQQHGSADTSARQTPRSRSSSKTVTTSVFQAAAAPSAAAIPTPPSSAAWPNDKRKKKKAEQERTPKKNVASLQQQQQQQIQHTMAELEHARAELLAQHDELERAAAQMQLERTRHQEEMEDVLLDHEDELTQLRDGYQQQMLDQQQHYEQLLAQAQQNLRRAEQMHQQEGGDMTKELHDALDRERQALQELEATLSEKEQLEMNVAVLTAQRKVLEENVVSLTSAAKEAAERERQAEEKADVMLSQHKRQLQQKQERETQLERTVAELGTALTLAQEQQQRATVVATPTSADDNAGTVGENTAERITSYKAQYLAVADELEASKTQVALLDQEREALQKELHDMSVERTAEAAAVQERQRLQDERTNALMTQVAHLEASLREMKQRGSSDTTTATMLDAGSSPPNARALELSRELEQMRMKLSSTSDQHMRQKSLAESLKAEIVALKSRLESEALKAASADAQIHELESGRAGYASSRVRRRRVQGGVGGGRYSQLPSRSLLSAFGIQVARGSIGEQVAITIDAVDTWMLETGSIMRHEPLARLGFAFYMTMVHLWCFCLVFFHTVESEHGDLGNLTARRGTVHP